MSNLLKDASILLTPTAYDNGSMNAIKPESGDGDFDFQRNSAATRVNAQGLVENVQIISPELVSNGNFSETGTEEILNGNFSQEGSELVTNGDFATDSDWNGADLNGFSISDGKLILTNALNTKSVYQSVSLTVGSFYKVTFEISNYVKGTVITFLGGNYNSPLQTSNGVFTSYLTPLASTTVGIKAIDVDGTTLSIDNVSVKQVGLNWGLGIDTGWSIGDNKAIALEAATGERLQQNSVFVVGKTYKVTYEITEISQGGFRGYVGGANLTTRSTVGTYTEILVAPSNSQFYIETIGTTSGSVTNISVKEVGQDWSLGTGVSIGNNVAISNGSGGSYESIVYQDTNISFANKKVKIKFDVLDYVSGKMRVSPGNSSVTPHVQANGSYEFIVDVGVGTDILYFTSYQVPFNGSITNISVKEITDDTNIPRINYEGFSYQDSLGSELVVNGDFSNGSANWSLSSECEVVNSQARIYSSDGGFQYIQQNGVFDTSKQYKLEFDVISSNGAVLGFAGGIPDVTTNVLGKKTLYVSPSLSTLQIKRSSGITDVVIDNVSVKEVLGQEVVPDSGCGSWLLENQSTNLITYSEDFSNSYWTKVAASVTSGFTSPDGTNNAYKFVESTSDGAHVFYNSNFPSTNGEDYTYSLFVKYNGRQWFRLWGQYGNSNFSAYFDIQNGLLGSKDSGMTTNIEDYSNGWYRISATATSDGTANRFRGYLAEVDNDPFYQGNGTSGVYIWGAQVENQSHSTSYIPTNGATNTRLQDIANNSGNSSLINSTEGVLYSEYEIGGDDSDGYQVISIKNINNSNDNVVGIGKQNNSNDIFIRLTMGGTDIFNNLSATPRSGFNKVAISYKSGDSSAWVNGTKVHISSVNFTPSDNFDKLNLAWMNFDSLAFYGKNKALAVYKEALTDEELEALTTI